MGVSSPARSHTTSVAVNICLNNNRLTDRYRQTHWLKTLVFPWALCSTMARRTQPEIRLRSLRTESCSALSALSGWGEWIREPVVVRPFLKPRRRELVTHVDEQFASEQGGWLVGEQREVSVGGWWWFTQCVRGWLTIDYHSVSYWHWCFKEIYSLQHTVQRLFNFF